MLIQSIYGKTVKLTDLRRMKSIWGICLLLLPLMVQRADAGNVPPMTISSLLASAFPAIPNPNDVGAVSKWLKTVASLSHRIRVTVIGHSGQGREILGVIAEGDQIRPHRLQTVAIICRQHGNEPAPTLAALELILDVATNIAQDKHDLLQQMRFVIIPIASPDGAIMNHRFIEGGKNPNRDWGVFQLPETRNLEAFLLKANPDVLLDCHELLPGDYSTQPYVECEEGSTKLAHCVLQEEHKDGCPIEIGRTASDCPPTLLYRYFAHAHHKQALMLESALVGDHHMEARTRMHRAAAWAAAKFVVQQNRSPRR